MNQQEILQLAQHTLHFSLSLTALPYPWPTEDVERYRAQAARAHDALNALIHPAIAAEGQGAGPSRAPIESRRESCPTCHGSCMHGCERCNGWGYIMVENTTQPPAGPGDADAELGALVRRMPELFVLVHNPFYSGADIDEWEVWDKPLGTGLKRLSAASDPLEALRAALSRPVEGGPKDA